MPDEIEIGRDPERQIHQPLHNKYFSQIGFPRFTSRLREEEVIFDELGCRHQYARFQQRKMTEDYKKDGEFSMADVSLQKKNSTIEIMNI